MLSFINVHNFLTFVDIDNTFAQTGLYMTVHSIYINSAITVLKGKENYTIATTTNKCEQQN